MKKKEVGEKESMADIFAPFSEVKSENKEERLESLIAYEKHYMSLLRNYKNEISEIELMMENLRKEREEFYLIKIPKIEKSINANRVLSDEAKEEWISKLRLNAENSFAISESLISHYVTSNLDEFKRKMQAAMKKV